MNPASLPFPAWERPKSRNTKQLHLGAECTVLRLLTLCASSHFTSYRSTFQLLPSSEIMRLLELGSRAQPIRIL